MSDPTSVAPFRWSLLRRDTGLVVVNDLRIADGYWSRLAGLQFRATLPVGRGMLLVKSASVHTFWMRFPIDIAFIGSDGRVLGIRRGARPWRVAAGPRGTHAVLETKAGWLQLEPGARLAAVCASDQDLLRRRRSMSFLGPVAAGGQRVEFSERVGPEPQNA